MLFCKIHYVYTDFMLRLDMFFSLVCIYIFIHSVESKNMTASRVFELGDQFRTDRFNGKWLVLFYTPWCERSINFFGFWDEVANNYSVTGLRVAKLDINVYRKSGASIGITSTPTIIFYNFGIQYVLDGDLSKDAVIRHIESINADLLIELHDYSNFPTLLLENSVIFLCVYNGTIDSSVQQIYQNTAIGFKHKAKFFYTSKSHPDNLLIQFPIFVVYKSTQPYYYDGIISAVDLKRWVLQEHYPVFPLVQYSDMHHIIGNWEHKLVGIFAYEDNLSSATQLWNATIYTLARQRKFIRNVFIFSTFSCNIIQNIIGDCPSLPRFVLWNTSNLMYFELGVYLNDMHLSVDDLNNCILEEFVQKVIRKEIIPISGFSYGFAIEAIISDIYLAQMGLLYSYPFVSKICIIFFLVLSCGSCVNFLYILYLHFSNIFKGPRIVIADTHN